jgi:chitodextrinase
VVSGGTSSELEYITTIAAPPVSRVEANKEPVAVIRCNDSEATVAEEQVNIVVTAGQDIYVDGLDSYDEDGDITSYQWDFGDGRVAAKAAAFSVYEAEEDPYDEATAYHVFYGTGAYTITLTVTDDKGATGSTQFTLNVEEIDASIKFRPRRLKLKQRKGKRMYATVKFPAGCDATQVSIDAFEVIEGGTTQIVDFENSKHGLVVKNSKKYAKKNKFKIKFDRRAVIDAISVPSDETVLGVWGAVVCNGKSVPFSAYDTIKTIEPKKKHSKKYERDNK